MDFLPKMGELKFEGFETKADKDSKYMIVDVNTKAKVVWNSIKTNWNLNPELIISMIGDSKKLALDSDSRKVLKKGLYGLAKSTNAVFLTGGTHYGVNKFVGRVAREYMLEDYEEKICVVGIVCLEGIVHGDAINRCTEKTYEYCQEVDCKEGVFLDSNHTHFLFLKTKIMEKKFRASFEKYFRPRTKVIPEVMLMMDGSEESVKKANLVAEHRIPVIVMMGSCRADDLTTDASELNKLKAYEKMPIVCSIKESDDLNKLLEQKLLVSVFLLEKTEKNDFVNVVLKSLLKAYNENRQKMSIIELAFSCDKSEDIDKEINAFAKTEANQFDNLMTKAIENNKVNWVKMLLDINENLSNYSNNNKQIELYKKALQLETKKDIVKKTEKKNKFENKQSFFKKIEKKTEKTDECSAKVLKRMLKNFKGTLVSGFRMLFMSNEDDKLLLKIEKIINDLSLNYSWLIFFNEDSRSLDATLPETEDTGENNNTSVKEETETTKLIKEEITETTELIKEKNTSVREETESTELTKDENKSVKAETETECIEVANLLNPDDFKDGSDSSDCSDDSEDEDSNVHQRDDYQPIKIDVNPLDKEEYSQNKNFDAAKRLFLFSLLIGNVEMSYVFLYKCPEPINCALTGSIILQELAKITLLKHQELDLAKSLKMHASNYEKIAAGILKEAYQKNVKMSHDILTRVSNEWGDRTAFTCADRGNLKYFIAEDCCQTILNNTWYGNIDNNTSWWRLSITMFFPIFLPLLIKFNDDEEMREHNFFRRNIKHFWDFINSPVVKFGYHTVWYIIFLLLFSYFLIIELKPSSFALNKPVSLCEAIVLGCAFSVWIDEFKQIYSKGNAYFNDPWNYVDHFVFILFLSSLITRLTVSNEKFYIARILYVITFIFSMIRIFETMYINKDMGPKVIMLGHMITNLVFFLCVCLVIMLAYGIAAQSLLYPNAESKGEIFYNIFKAPFYTFFGEFDEIDYEAKEENCVNLTQIGEERTNATEIYENEKCEEKDRHPDISTFVSFLYAFYVLASNLVLINLLIALFGFTINKVQDESTKTWQFFRFRLIESYTRKSFLIPPFYIFSHIYSFLMCCLCRPEKDLPLEKRYNDIRKEEDDNSILKLNKFEMSAKNSYYDNKEEAEKNQLDMKSLSDEIKNLKKIIEKGYKKEKSTDCDSAVIPLLCVHG